MSERTDMLKRVQQLEFVKLEAGLFLDNQPENEAAMSLFNKYRALAAEARKEYEDAYGPLTQNGVNIERDGWSWVNMPWPWQVEV